MTPDNIFILVFWSLALLAAILGYIIHRSETEGDVNG